ncbi:MAG: serine/threonine-protein kinase [Planctomycetota bacterium]|nr:serine/threonine-protein kinase [Planctomycetota bacterium]
MERGSKFRGLVIHSILGAGAMGEAYLASHPVLRTSLVVKTFKVTPNVDIFSEAHLAARVRSTNIVSALDAGVESGVAFVVQDYVDGIDLAELLSRTNKMNWRLPIGVVADLVCGAARGRHAIHQAGVIHRDVKPANLFMKGSGECAVGDFGIAVSEGGNGGPTAGTPRFMAPEQWDNEMTDRRTDVYALGGSAHMLATGSPPFKAQNMIQHAHAHTTTNYRAPETDSPEEAFFFSVVSKALKKIPEERQGSTEEIAKKLMMIVEPRPQLTDRTERSARFGDLTIALSKGDIAKARVDVIVSAANWKLGMHVGVAGALRKAGGDEIEEEAEKSAPASMGDVVWTGAGKLNAQYVAHAIAALGGAVCIQRCMFRILLEAEERKMQSMALPALGTGVGQVPMSLAASQILEAIQTFAWLKPQHVRNIHLILFDDPALATWKSVLDSI